MTETGSARAPLRASRHSVVTRPITKPPDLLGVVPGDAATLWITPDGGLVAWGEIDRIEVGTGTDRFERAARELDRIFASMEVRDEVGVFGTGPVAFGSFTFDPSTPGSFLVVPQVVVGRTGNTGWITSCNGAGFVVEEKPPPAAERAPVVYGGSSIPEEQWLEAVDSAVIEIERGRLDKVVLARDVKLKSRRSLDAVSVAQRLTKAFPQCFTFSYDGLVGATPELLIRKVGTAVESMPLAGSARRDPDEARDEVIGGELLRSSKNIAEHRLAVDSVTNVLEPLCDDMVVEEPSLLRLENVQHLATRVRGELAGGLGSLRLAGMLHPTAAVCGVPADEAMSLIGDLEGMERRRYAGPVGWVGASGDGEWGIALRCAELSGRGARLFAGAGIVAGSRPEAELEETRLKLRAMLSAL